MILDLGSDHIGILFTITSPTRTSAPNNTSNNTPRFITSKANWRIDRNELTKNLTKLYIITQIRELQSLVSLVNPNYLELNPEFEDKANKLITDLTSAISMAASAAIPRASPNRDPKP